MFESTTEAPPHWIRRLVRSVWFRGAVFAFSLASFAAVGTGWWLWTKTISYDCALEEVDLSIDELIALKKRMRHYQGDEADDALMELSGDELSFYVWNKTGYQVRFATDGEHLAARIVVPSRNNTCYNIDFVGDVQVEDGVANVSPDHMRIGKLDVSDWVRGQTFKIRPNQLDDESGDVLANTDRFEVLRGRVRVGLSDRRSVW